MSANTATSSYALTENDPDDAQPVSEPADALPANEAWNVDASPSSEPIDTDAPAANERAGPGAQPTRRLLRTHEVSALYGIPVAQLEVLRHRGGGSRFVKLGRAVYYRPEDVEDWIAANIRKSTSDPGGAGGIA